MKNSRKNTAGFTLIEMLFYMVFIIFIIGSTLGIVSQLLRNSELLKTGISTEEEGNFVLKKISWAMNDASSISSPARNSSSDTLIVSKNEFTPNPVKVDMLAGKVMLSRGTNTPKQLSNDRFVISGLKFERTWDGINPGTDSIRVSFEINGRQFQLTRRVK